MEKLSSGVFRPQSDEPTIGDESFHGSCSEKSRKKKASCSILILFFLRAQLEESIPVFEARVSLEIVQKSQGK